MKYGFIIVQVHVRVRYKYMYVMGSCVYTCTHIVYIRLHWNHVGEWVCERWPSVYTLGQLSFGLWGQSHKEFKLLSFLAFRLVGGLVSYRKLL